MKATKAILLGCCALVLLAVAACSGSDSASTPVAPENEFDALVDEVVNSNSSGAVKVDSYCSNSCYDPDREDNTIEPGRAGTVAWIVDGSFLCGTSDVDYVIYDKGNDYVASGALAFVETCPDGKTRKYTFTSPPAQSGSGSVTLHAYCNGTKLGSDSFRTYNNGICDR